MSQRRKIIYSVLKEIENGDGKPSWTDYGVEKEYFAQVVEMMQDEGLIKDASVLRAGIGNKAQAIILKGSQITMKGLDYLEENSALAKTYKGLKKVREWLPL